MMDLLTKTLGDGPMSAPALILAHMLTATALGAGVVLIYRWTRSPVEQTPSFQPTLLFMTILIAMSTEVIGTNTARAFSLVGALSIVRFRTVVRDTLDTAYVIFGVVVGMAVGAGQLAVAMIGLAVVGVVAFGMRSRPRTRAVAASLASFVLTVRVGLGQDVETGLGPILDAHLAERRLLSMATAKQGIVLDVAYEVRFRRDHSADALVKALNLVDGVQSVDLKTREAQEDVLG